MPLLASQRLDPKAHTDRESGFHRAGTKPAADAILPDLRWRVLNCWQRWRRRILAGDLRHRPPLSAARQHRRDPEKPQNPPRPLGGTDLLSSQLFDDYAKEKAQSLGTPSPRTLSRG